MKKPKIVQKNFKCTGKEKEYSSNILAKNHAQARYKAYQEWGMSEYTHYTSVFNYISVKRNPVNDLLENTPHPRLSELSQQQIKEMSHAIGHEYFKEPYRNRFVVEHSDLWEDLIQKGMAGKSKAIGQNFYWVTDLGIEVITSLQPVPRYLVNVPLKTILEASRLTLK